MSLAIDVDSDSFVAIEFPPIQEPPFVQELQISAWIQWAGLQLQKPLYSLSESTFRAYASTRYSEENLKVYVYAVLALGIIGIAMTAPLCLLGAGLYWASDIISQKPYTYLKATGPEITPNNTLKMMTLNTCMLPGGLPFVLGGLPPASKRIGKLETLIRNQNPDVLLLQEMAHGPSMELYQKIQDLYPHFFIRIGPNPPLMESGLFIASRFPIHNKGFIPYDNQFGILRGAFWIETKEAVIFTSHLEYGEKKNHMRIDQLNKIKEKMGEFEKPCFLLGDLNIDRYVDGHYEECQIAEDFSDPIPKNTPTCCCKLETVMRGTSIPTQPNEQDDYALLRKKEPGAFYLDTEIIDTYKEDRPHDATSDHKAILLTATKRKGSSFWNWLPKS